MSRRVMIHSMIPPKIPGALPGVSTHSRFALAMQLPLGGSNGQLGPASNVTGNQGLEVLCYAMLFLSKGVLLANANIRIMICVKATVSQRSATKLQF